VDRIVDKAAAKGVKLVGGQYGPLMVAGYLTTCLAAAGGAAAGATLASGPAAGITGGVLLAGGTTAAAIDINSMLKGAQIELESARRAWAFCIHWKLEHCDPNTDPDLLTLERKGWRKKYLDEVRDVFCRFN